MVTKKVKLIKTKKDHQEVLGYIEKLMSRSSDLRSAERELLDILAILVQEYETKKFPSKIPDPITAIKFRMEQEGLAQKDLVPYIGSRGRVSEILSGKRSLTLEMIRKLSDGLDIPLQSLVGESVSKPRTSPVKERRPQRQKSRVRLAI